MADIDNRKLLPERMEFEFRMREIDKEGREIREVEVRLNAPDSITHPEITEAYQKAIPLRRIQAISIAIFYSKILSSIFQNPH